MNIYAAIAFGIFGIGLGWLIPAIADKIVIFKNKKRNVETIVWRFDGKPLMVLLAILNGLLWAYAGLSVKSIPLAFFVALIFTLAILISVIDLRIRLIPNELLLFILIPGAAFQLLYFGRTALFVAATCGIAVGLIFTAVAGIMGFGKVGAGDVKLSAIMGFVLGYPHILVGLIGMSAALLIYCSVGLVTRKLKLNSMFAFAPFMMLGTIFALVYSITSI